jgi:tetratricopeptide (TPR) repeat protein
MPEELPGNRGHPLLQVWFLTRTLRTYGDWRTILTRRSVLTVSLMLLLVACSSDTSTAPSSLSPEADEATALVTEVSDSFDAGELEDGMAALAELTHRFGESTDRDVARTVARTLYNSGTFLQYAGSFEAALAPYEDLVLLFGASTDPVVLSDVVDGLFNQGLALHELGKHEEELAAFETIDTYRDSTDPYVVVLVAKALNNKGITLYELDRGFDEQLAAFGEVISRYGDSPDPNNAPNLARAYFSKGYALETMGLPADAVEAYDEVIRRYSDSEDPLVASFVDAAQQQLYGMGSSDTVEPLLYELRSRSGYWIGVSDDAIRSSAQTICSIAEASATAEAFVAEAFVERLFGALEEDHSPERTGELLAIVEFVDYCAVEGDEMLRELMELAADV